MGETFVNVVNTALHQQGFKLGMDTSQWKAPKEPHVVSDLNRIIENLDIAPVFIRRLRKNDITYYGDLIQRNGAQLLELKIPKSVIVDIVEQLRRLDFKLGTKLKNWNPPK
jgi:DNA-directed RNA polymerase alpha subunit